LGSLFPMPGGLKENVEHYLGKSIRIDKCEGISVVFKALDDYAKKSESKLPLLFDVLNCAEGCNLGTGCKHDKDLFDMNTAMDEFRQAVTKGDKIKYLDELYERFDKELRLEDFIRSYTPVPVRQLTASAEAVEKAFNSLNKFDEKARAHDCGACGCDTCHEMAVLIAKGVSVPENCIDKMHREIKSEHEAARENLLSFGKILTDTSEIKDMTAEIVESIDNINVAINAYNRMIVDIEKIAMQINIIAINASIEAARAGSHGRSFGVVAEEIRRLAHTSNASAQQTKEASVKAASAITSVNESVAKISVSINESYENIYAVSESTKKTLGQGHKH
jgi:hypothetical protein